MARCRILNYGDETYCSGCSLRWDTNDRDPPQCPEESKKPSVEDGFLLRICKALDVKPKQLAKLIGVTYGEIKPLINTPACQIGDLDYDDTWIKLHAYISHRMGMILAVKGELDKELQKDRVARLQRMERWNNL